MQEIWRCRGLYRDETKDTPIGRVEAVFRGRLRSSYSTGRMHSSSGAARHHMVAATKLNNNGLTLHALEPSRPQLMTTHNQYTLCFDGGSRGNHGPGGSRSGLVRIGGWATTPDIVWIASVSYAFRTTTNTRDFSWGSSTLRGLTFTVYTLLETVNSSQPNFVSDGYHDQDTYNEFMPNVACC